MKTKTTIEIVYDADPKEYEIRDYLIQRLENPNHAFGVHRHNLLGTLGIIGGRDVKINISFEEVE